MALRIFISDATEGGTHGTTLKSAISTGYGSDISDQITLRMNATYSIEQVRADMAEAYASGYQVFCTSAYGIMNLYRNAIAYYPTMLVFTPMGLNSYEDILAVSAATVIVASGAGDTQNRTAYGNGMEFWDTDPSGGMASSFSNGVVCGKMLYIKDRRNCDWWTARYSARQTASGSGAWTTTDGYGQIDSALAVSWNGGVSTDPFIESSDGIGVEPPTVPPASQALYRMSLRQLLRPAFRSTRFLAR